MIVFFEKSYNQIGRKLDSILHEEHTIFKISNTNKLVSAMQLIFLSFKILFNYKLYSLKDEIFIHRSNNKYTIFLTSFFDFFNLDFYTYSDGIGDNIYNFHGELHRNYKGHYGIKKNYMGKKFYREIDLKWYIESWVEYIEFSTQSNNALVQFKYPKHSDSKADVDIKYTWYLNQLLSKGINHFYISGYVPKNSFFLKHKNLFTRINTLNKLSSKLSVKYFISTPSSSFISICNVIPENYLIIVETSDPYNDSMINSINFFISAMRHLLVKK